MFFVLYMNNGGDYMDNKEILLVSDFVGVGKVALSTMIPILSTMEAKLSYLPTANISNNFGYGEAVIHDLTEFMRDSKDMWKKHGFKFDIIATGILMNVEQVRIVEEIINWHEVRPIVITDPIMGDGGEVYPGLASELVDASREMALLADIIIPNLTELALMLGEKYPENMTDETMEVWLKRLMEMGVKSAAITSVKIDKRHYVYGYGTDRDIFRIEYKHVPIDIGGSGDIFTSLLIGRMKKDFNLRDSIEYATNLLSHIIEAEYNRGVRGYAMEVSIEKYLQDIYKELNE